jgi:hypothetical protein
MQMTILARRPGTRPRRLTSWEPEALVAIGGGPFLRWGGIQECS